MAVALGVFWWPPETFWRATPRELAAALQPATAAQAREPATSGDLVRLMRAFPDSAAVIPGRAEGPNPEPTTG
jgi:uncharacterized phage protein (TIGR02216 family)